MHFHAGTAIVFFALLFALAGSTLAFSSQHGSSAILARNNDARQWTSRSSVVRRNPFDRRNDECEEEFANLCDQIEANAPADTLDAALKRYAKKCQQQGILSEVRKRCSYEKPSVRRKKKSEAARRKASH